MTRVMIAAGQSYDLPSTTEMHDRFEALDRKFAELVREQVRGIKLMRLPTVSVVAGAGAITIPAQSSGYGLSGPESGFLWRVGRITVSSSGADNAGSSVPAVSQPGVPATTVAAQNTNAFPVKVVLTGFTATAVVVNGLTVGITNGTYTVPAFGSISVTYTVAGTWVWSSAGIVTSPGTGVALYTTSDETSQPRNLIDSTLQVGQGYYPSSRGVFVMPSEGLLVSIPAPVPGNTYILTGQVWSVPAEMMGKLAS